MLTVRNDITFNSDGLKLEGVLYLPEGQSIFPGVVICHPHPRHGGDMDNSIVISVARSLCNAGIGVLRFNFRGVGMSEGEFDGGVGEICDAREAVNFLALHDNIDASRIGIAGYSFGAAVTLIAAHENETVQAIASIACPSRVFGEMGAQEILQPKLLIGGEHDHDFPAGQFKFLSTRYSGPKQIEVIYGADHFFGGHVSEVAELVTAFFCEYIGNQQGQFPER